MPTLSSPEVEQLVLANLPPIDHHDENLTVTFIRPAKAADLIGQARLVHAGNRHAYVGATIYTDGNPDPIAHVTATYAIART